MCPDKSGLSLHTDFENLTVFKPSNHGAATLTGLLDEVIAWSTALAPLLAQSTAPWSSQLLAALSR
jgi:hypothetical protein